jgi:hypothetical protein
MRIAWKQVEPAVMPYDLATSVELLTAAYPESLRWRRYTGAHISLKPRRLVIADLSVAMRKSPLVARWRSPLVASESPRSSFVVS